MHLTSEAGADCALMTPPPPPATPGRATHNAAGSSLTHLDVPPLVEALQRKRNAGRSLPLRRCSFRSAGAS
jgi:hypothetical protein